jgi:hypothetical protein
MKVIQPLFLDELYEEFEKAKYNPTALNKLLNRIANIRIFDPACGSGNFLIIAYKQLRLLEIKILTQLRNLHNNTEERTGFEENQTALFKKDQLTLADNKPKTAYQTVLFSRIELNHFYGIELDDFAHEIAKLSLWLAQHQMNMEFNNLLGATNPSLPLSDAGQITQGNATRLDWETICPKPKVGEVFILGNPPYLGFNERSGEQKEDMNFVFNTDSNIKRLDYIGCWFKKGSDFIKDSNFRFSFVTTNSICQGEQVSLLWPYIYSNNQEIFFAYQSFKWGNLAKNNAGITCIIIGISHKSNIPKRIFTLNKYFIAKNINPYLTEGNPIIINQRTSPISNFPEMILGSSGIDGGFLVLSKEEKDNFIQHNINSEKYIKPFIGGSDFINGITRYCLWINDNDVEKANKISLIKERIDKVKEFRKTAGRDAQKGVNIPHRFFYRKHKETTSIILPMTSSERRNYLPVGFLSSTHIASNGVLVIYNAETFIFSILVSRLHLLWTMAVSGKLRMDIRYSVNLCYNNFPFPPITQAQKDELENHTHNILKARANHTQKTLAEMYDPNKMPDDLRAAHQANDLAIEKCYREKPFDTDEERLAYLFNLYEQMIEEEKTKGTLFALEPKAKPTKKAKKK